MILLEVPNWFAQVLGVGFSIIAFLLALLLLWAVFVEYLWEHFPIYKTIFYAMWEMKHGHRDWFEITWEGQKARWRRAKK